MTSIPKSVHEKTGGMLYFARMLDKMRLHDAGQLHPNYHANLGLGADSLCTGFLRVAYTDLRERVLEGATDDEALAWCYEKGHRLEQLDVYIWNQFMLKLGWHDRAAHMLEKYKHEANLADRTDIVTMADFMEVDEGRKP